MTETVNETQGALAGVRILDFGRYVAGPYCATLMADFGADVIRIERPGGGEDRGIAPVSADGSGDGALFQQMNRNKRSLTFDPASPQARDIIIRLVRSADVVVVNVPHRALKRMGLDYATLRAIREDIILCNLSSFGSIGPWASRPGFDSVGQAMCGSAYLSGQGDVPFRTPITWVDHATGLYAAFGVMVALFERQRSGCGQELGGSLLASALSFSATFLIEEALTGLDRKAIGNRSFLNGPTDTFRTADGWVVTQVVGQPIFERWAGLIGEPAWIADPRFATDQLRGVNGAELSARMALWCAVRTSEEALDALAGAGIPAGPILSPSQALAHPQVQALEILHTPGGGAGAVFRTPIELSATPATIRSAAPAAGAHTEELLAELGFSGDEIHGLRQSSTI
ncbi:MAG: CoA transferase [Pseudomonadota bacterium]